jgi:hypothetical protein
LRLAELTSFLVVVQQELPTQPAQLWVVRPHQCKSAQQMELERFTPVAATFQLRDSHRAVAMEFFIRLER